MINILLLFWIISAVLTLQTQRLVRIVVYLGIFSAISAICFFALGAPDVAMAEVAISSFMTVFLIVCFEKYFRTTPEKAPEAVPEVTAEAASRAAPETASKAATETASRNTLEKSQQPPLKADRIKTISKILLPICFTFFLFVLFIYNIPDVPANTYLKEQYLTRFKSDIGGENAVTAIYLGYRVYDTLFEALMLLVSVLGVAHMSLYKKNYVDSKALKSVPKPGAVDYYTIRIICPAMLLFGIYLVMNGHLSPGGGFQGGVAITSFFICRYLIKNVADVNLDKIMILEKIIFAEIVLLAIFFIFLGVHIQFPQLQNVYLIMMNILISLKVAYGFVIIFCRYVAFERQ
jgi:multicomponent Na+:H+ antiporter subunit B